MKSRPEMILRLRVASVIAIWTATANAVNSVS